MNFRQLEYIIAVDRYRNFKRAAIACDVAQSTLSKEIQRIENFFVKKYSSKYALLMPSGRAAINLILNYFKFNRSNVFG